MKFKDTRVYMSRTLDDSYLFTIMIASDSGIRENVLEGCNIFKSAPTRRVTSQFWLCIQSVYTYSGHCTVDAVCQERI